MRPGCGGRSVTRVQTSGAVNAQLRSANSSSVASVGKEPTSDSSSTMANIGRVALLRRENGFIVILQGLLQAAAAIGCRRCNGLVAPRNDCLLRVGCLAGIGNGAGVALSACQVHGTSGRP